MKKVILIATFVLIGLGVVPSVRAIEFGEKITESYLRGEVVSVPKSGTVKMNGQNNLYQLVKVKTTEGKDLTIEQGKRFTLTKQQLVSKGDSVVIIKLLGEKSHDVTYQIIDKYRIDNIVRIFFVFFALILILTSWRGLGSIIGLLLSLLIIVKFIVPQILAGGDPLLVSIIGALIIMATTIPLAHGFSKQTGIAVLATFIALVITGLLAVIFVSATSLTGLGSDDAYGLQFSVGQGVNFSGLLLGGMIIGVLGILDDVTTGQSAYVFEISKANPKLGIAELFKSGLSVGREHITSLVNTLVLAYAGVAMPMFIFMVQNPRNQPMWVWANSEILAEEIVRALVGSMGLVLAVPITTFLAAWFVAKKRKALI